MGGVRSTCWKLRHAYRSDRHKRRRTIYDRMHGCDDYFGSAWTGSGGVSNEDDSWEQAIRLLREAD